jgi:SpoVK/Ycf46/Vps4 family AAA+-type ATPase
LNDDKDAKKPEIIRQKAEERFEKETENPEMHPQEEQKQECTVDIPPSDSVGGILEIVAHTAVERKDSPAPQVFDEPGRLPSKKPTQSSTLEMFWDPVVRELGVFPASNIYIDMSKRSKKKRYRPARWNMGYVSAPPPPPSFNSNPPNIPYPRPVPHVPPPLAPYGPPVIPALTPVPPPPPPPPPGPVPPPPPISLPAYKPKHRKSPKRNHEPRKNGDKGKECSKSNSADSEAPDEADIGILPQSAAAKEWERMKREMNYVNAALDDLMDLTGIEKIKQQFLDIKSWIETLRRQGVDAKKENYNLVLLGNPGTGKTTIAHIYGLFLLNEGVLSGHKIVERFGAELEAKSYCARQDVEQILDSAYGGAYFVDEAHQLTFSNSGKDAIDELLNMMNNEKRVVFIFAGNAKEMDDFFGYAPGVAASAWQFDIPDFTEKEILHTFVHRIRKRFDKKMKVEGGETGLHARIVARRIVRGSGKDGFANMRTLENTMMRIYQRQAKRLQEARRERPEPDDFNLIRDDLLGPEPQTVFEDDEAWKTLQEMVGLESVKQSVRSFIHRLHLNHQRDLLEKEPIKVGLCKVFLGPPGTGKSTVAKFYGKILARLGLLSKGNVIQKTAIDLLGDQIGESECKVRAALKASAGCVLIIDEAHTMNPTRRNGWDDTSYCEYRQGIIDTLVSMVSNAPGEDRCVILMGYPDEMKQLLSSANPGLARRFPIEDAFIFESFDDDQLAKILDMKLQKQGLQTTPEARTVALKQLSIARQRPNFGNGGAIDNLLSRAKERYQKRQSQKLLEHRLADVVFEHEDFDPDYARTMEGIDEIDKMFKDFVGFDETIATFRRYQRRVKGMRARGLDPKDFIPFTFVFKGSPGTGKTSTARKIGQLYYNMGLLAASEVIEVSVKDMVASYVGQSPTKTNELLVSAIGKVLFIDEAYRLDSDRHFQEALDQLVDCLSKPKFEKKLLVALAGYDGPMDTLMNRNPGLRSRFPTEITFTNLSPSSCFQLVKRRIEDAKIDVDDITKDIEGRIEKRFRELSETDNWGNGRDVVTLAVDIIGTVYETVDDGKPLMATGDVICGSLEAMLKERKQYNSTSLEHIFL